MKTLSAEDFYRESRGGIVIDVRSPVEFSAGHIPEAVNISLFSDDERKQVGTLYKQSGRENAIEKGLEFVGPKMVGFVRQTRELLAKTDRNQPVFAHCWRGGMRSQSFAWLLGTAGIDVRVLEGGYKAFRKLAHRQIGFRHRMVVLSGLTGAGKTEYLKMFREAGEQVVDIEKLANHRGSSFGALGLGQQPTTEQFENRLFVALEALDPNKRFWVEDEGSRLGHVVVPARFVKQIRRSPAVFLDVCKERRLDNLMAEYGNLDTNGLVEATRGIQKRLGGQNMIDAINAIESGDLRKAADITLSYYDRSYLKAMDGLPRESTSELSTKGLDDKQVVAEAIERANSLMPECDFKGPTQLPA
jgi:tRNA 2-selenouridine synthase